MAGKTKPYSAGRWIRPTDTWIRPIVLEISPGHLADDLSVVWPWPYTDEEIERIGGSLPAAVRRRALEEVIGIGRRAVFSRKYGRQHGEPKPNVRAELQRLKEAVAELTKAAKNLSAEGWSYIAAGASPYGPFRSKSTALTAIFHLEADDIKPKIAPGTSRGKPNSNLVGDVILDLLNTFTAAHDGITPRAGFPQFRDACLAPLRLREPGAKGKESQLQKARRRRKNTPAKF
jgi:hypothetical protein